MKVACSGTRGDSVEGARELLHLIKRVEEKFFNAPDSFSGHLLVKIKESLRLGALIWASFDGNDSCDEDGKTLPQVFSLDLGAHRVILNRHATNNTTKSTHQNMGLRRKGFSK